MTEGLFFLFGIIGIVLIVYWYIQNRVVIEKGHTIEEGGDGRRGLLAMKEEERPSSEEKKEEGG